MGVRGKKEFSNFVVSVYSFLLSTKSRLREVRMGKKKYRKRKRECKKPFKKIHMYLAMKERSKATTVLILYALPFFMPSPYLPH